jgi:hypothetical protein
MSQQEDLAMRSSTIDRERRINEYFEFIIPT